MIKLSVVESECDCERCSRMCHAPCCGTPDDIRRLIDAGYADRLMLDDWDEGIKPVDMLKPALKGAESQRAPWETESMRGCTFWRDGKCELHKLGLKPSQGKLALHGQTREQGDEINDYIRKNWKETAATKKLIALWKKAVKYKPPKDGRPPAIKGTAI